MKLLYVAIPIVLQFILGVLFFTVSSGSDDNTEAISDGRYYVVDYEEIGNVRIE